MAFNTTLERATMLGGFSGDAEEPVLGPGPHGITLTPAFQVYHDDNTDGFRMTVTVTDGLRMDAEVFRFRSLPVQPGQEDSIGVFDGVCSPADLEEFPIDEPLENADPPWFRKAVLDLVFRSRAEVDAAWDTIRNEIAALVETLDIMDNLEDEEEVRLGAS